MYKWGRKKAGLTIEDAAYKLNVAPRTLAKYEAGSLKPPDEIVVNMNKLYKCPWLTQYHCRKYCAIGMTYGYEIMNNVNLDLPSILLKLKTELEEATLEVSIMLEIAVNKNSRDDFTEDEWEKFIKAVHEFIDVEHVVETLKIALGHWTDVSEIVRSHNEKLYERGYIKKDIKKRADKKPATCKNLLFTLYRKGVRKSIMGLVVLE